jgi:hypothetical protein
MKTIRTISTLVAAAALLAVPATAVAAKGGQGKAQGQTKSCAKAPKVGYHVKGTLVSMTADDPATTDVFEGTVTITVTSANSHARKSGDIADQDPATEGVQVAGATYTVPATDADGFDLALHDFEGADTPSAGDLVKISGRIPRTKARCAAEGTSLADRYGAVDVRRVAIWDQDADV